MVILERLHEFPFVEDTTHLAYYKEIVSKLVEPTEVNYRFINERYYIHKTRPFYVEGKMYYEVTYTLASDNVSKFDRHIAFTEHSLLENYALELSLRKEAIHIMGTTMPVDIIEDWRVSIRPCELNHFSRIFGEPINIQKGYKEYINLMNYLTNKRQNLLQIMEYDDTEFNDFKEAIHQKAQSHIVIPMFDQSRHIIQHELPGHHILRYLLYKMNNKVIKNQLDRNPNENLSDLKLANKSIPFDDMPFTSSLARHNPKFMDLIYSIGVADKSHELLAREVKNNTEIYGQLYTEKENLAHYEDVDGLMEKYNERLHGLHRNRKLACFGDNIFIKSYEKDIIAILRELQALQKQGDREYTASFDNWLGSTDYTIDCEQKKGHLREMFQQSSVSFVHGSAGTGKTTTINHLAHYFSDQSKLFLANTNPAVHNLQEKITASISNSTFKTIYSFLSFSQSTDKEYDVVIIDECSTVSNKDMRNILKNIKPTYLVLVGDVYQIESILFGNWFFIAIELMKNKKNRKRKSVFELDQPYRTEDSQLLTLWEKVREMNKKEDNDTKLLEHMVRQSYTHPLDESIFQPFSDDEIILCLNYDGLYGINNINRLLQGRNEHEAVTWGVHTFKVGDPILFNESNRFGPLIYNNLKGKIVAIEKSKHDISFELEVDKRITEKEAFRYDFELINYGEDWSVIHFTVNKYLNTDEDRNDSSAIIPFQVAYAVSIHKAQGLEYDSVKIVITNEVDELITHNIFYTAVTRSKRHLKVYWSPETEHKILSQMKPIQNHRDKSIIMKHLK